MLTLLLGNKNGKKKFKRVKKGNEYECKSSWKAMECRERPSGNPQDLMFYPITFLKCFFFFRKKKNL